MDSATVIVLVICILMFAGGAAFGVYWLLSRPAKTQSRVTLRNAQVASVIQAQTPRAPPPQTQVPEVAQPPVTRPMPEIIQPNQPVPVTASTKLDRTPVATTQSAVYMKPVQSSTMPATPASTATHALTKKTKTPKTPKTPKTKKTKKSKTTTPVTTNTTQVSSGEWRDAYGTVYNSYPACCPKSPNYSPSAPKGECQDYSGCKYLGEFAYGGHKTLDWLKQNPSCAMFAIDGSHKKYANKQLRVKNPKNGKILVVTVLDTCGDHDCWDKKRNEGCCTHNAKLGGGTLIDLESNTAKLFGWTDNDSGKFQWQPV